MEICTSCNIDRFFSHRAENGNTGRFLVIMSLENSARKGHDGINPSSTHL
jgi:Multi-copper polyphenol oxidoreductase laccase